MMEIPGRPVPAKARLMARGQMLLVVDDNRLLREQFAAALRAAGYEVLTAGDGQEAVCIAESRRPDAVLMDIVMPVMDGIAALRALRTRYPDLSVVMITAEEDSAIEQEAVQAGATEVLYKPIPLGDLVARVRELLA